MPESLFNYMAFFWSFAPRFKRNAVLSGFFYFYGKIPLQGSGSSSVGRASAFQAECREFEPRLPLQIFRSIYLACVWSIQLEPQKAHVAQLVELFLGKEEVHRFDSGRGLHDYSGLCFV